MSGLSLGNGLTIGGSSPTGAAGGDLSGTYPNPSVASIGGKAVTLGGALTTSGAFGLTLTLTGATNVTLPTSGTLAVLGANTFVGVQTLTTGSNSAPSINFGTANTGFYAGTNTVNVAVNGSNRIRLGNDLMIGSTTMLGWSSGTTVGTTDTALSRAAAGVVGVGTTGGIDGELRAAVVTVGQGTAIPAGGALTFGFKGTSTANFGIFFGSGAPTLSAAKGSLYLRSDGSGTTDRAYIATNSSGTWTALTTVA